MAGQEKSMYEKNEFSKRYQNQENKAVRQQEREAPGMPHQEIAKNRQGESVQASLNQTADQIQKQVQQSVEMKLQNNGVYEKSENMKKMFSGNNQAYMAGQDEVAKAFSAGEKAAKDYDAMQLNTDKSTSSVQDAARNITDDILFTASDNIEKNKSENKSKFGMEDALFNPVKKSVNSYQEEKHQFGIGKSLTRPVVDNVNVIKRSTSFKENNNDVPEAESADDGITYGQSDSAGNNSKKADSKSIVTNVVVYFVPDFETKGHTGKAASKGRTAMVDAVKFRPVVYIPDDSKSDYKEIKSNFYKVADGMKQVDAFDYAKKNSCKLSDIMKNDTNYVEMMKNADISKSSYPLKLNRYQSNVGDSVSPFATMTSSYQGYSASVSGKNYNADAFAAASKAVDKNAPKVKDMLETSYQTSVSKDRINYPKIYDEIDTANEYIMTKKNIISSDSYADKRAKYRAVLDLDNDYVNAQKIRYEKSGFPTDEISVLEKIGQIGTNSVEIKTLLKTDITPESIYSEYNQPTENSGLFVITSDNSVSTNFGQYLKNHQSDINGYIGDALGFADGAKNIPMVHIVDAGQTSNGLTSCAVVYDGVGEISNDGKDFDKIVRNSVTSVLNEYGDNRAYMSKNTYSATQNEINYASSYVSPYNLNVPTFNTKVEKINSPDKQTSIDTSLTAGYEASKENSSLNHSSISM